MRHKFTNILFILAAALLSTNAGANVVISQVYGGGGNASAPYTNDFIELFNAGSTGQDLTGWSVQYTSSAGTSWTNTTALPSVMLAPGKYLLIQEAAGTTTSGSLPAPDVTGSISMSATNGKVALVNSVTLLTGSCPTGSNVIDFLGFGTADCAEGTHSVAGSNTTALIRAANGCTDTNSNSDDFAAGTPAPRNTSTPANPCAGGTSTAPTGVGSATPNAVAAGAMTLLKVIVTPGTNPTSVNLAVTANLTSIGGASSVQFDDTGTNTDGTETFTYQATVSADQAPGARSISLTVNDEMNRVTHPSIALTIVGPPLTIMQIQGHGASSPYATQLVQTTPSIVTAKKSNGFFMQDANGDGDLTTSDGIFVFTSSAPTVSVGDAVSVTGKVQEFNGSTELSNITAVAVSSSGNTLPPAFVLDAHPPTDDPTTGICVGGASTLSTPPSRAEGYQASNFACLDGMLVAMNDGIVAGPTFGNSASDAVHTGTATGFYATLASQPRPFRAPGALYPGVINHPELPVWNGEPELIDVYYPGLNFNPTGFVYDAGTRFSVTGVIQGFVSFGTQIYELYPITGQLVTNMAVPPPTYPQPVADASPGTLTIGSQNFLHFFNDKPDGADTSGFNDTCAGTGASDTCPTQMEYQERVAKWTKQICEVLKSPVVIDVEEIENRSVLVDLSTSVQTACATSYVPYSIPGNDVSGINIGILVRSDVTVASVTQLYKNTQTANCSSGTSCGLNDRPPVLMRATWNGYDFALLAIYDRSLSGLGDTDANGNYTKPYVGPKRAEQAAQIAQIAQAWQSGATLAGAGNVRQAADGAITPGPFDMVGEANVPLFIAGDFNAYEFTDAYADVTGMIKGTAVRVQNLYWFDGSSADTDTPAYVAPNPTLVDSGDAANPAEKYSFNFDGYVQEIDHILLTRTAWKDFVSVSNAHGNADVSEASPIILDPTTAARSGDHDGQVISVAIDRIFANGFQAQP
ncbi:MAG: lamin tail domain-containing protein [Rudaea sp.]